MPKSTSVDVQARFLSFLLQEREVQPRALLLAQQITEILPGSAAVVYLLEEVEENTRWSSKAVAGDIHLDDDTIPLASGPLGLSAKDTSPCYFGSKPCPGRLRPPACPAHALSLAYVPMIVNEALIGAVEAATFNEVINEADLAGLVELVEHAAPAFSSATHYESNAIRIWNPSRA